MPDRAMRLVNGRPIATHETGEGTPVLFLHGFGIDHRSLLLTLGPVFERRRGYRRLHVDLPGFGESPADSTIDSSDAMLEVVLALIDEVIGDERFLLVGQSWGGYLARGVVARRAGQVAGVALR
jgi:pimeloyl-ACP methyl ester carboxylesterase